jgi:hypothetical protein
VTARPAGRRVSGMTHMLVADAILCSDTLTMLDCDWAIPAFAWSVTCPKCLSAYATAEAEGDANAYDYECR